MAWQRAAAIGARPSRVSARTAVWAGVWDGRVGWGALNGMMREVRCGGSGSRVLGAGAREGVAEVAGVHAAAGGHGAAHQGLGWLDAGARGLLRLPRHRRRGAGVRGAPALDPPGDAGVPGVGIAPPERQDAGGVRGAGVHELARLVLLADGFSRQRAGVRGARLRPGDGRVGALGRCGISRGAREALRRAHGDPAHVGRGGRDGVRVRDAGVLAGTGYRPGAAASEGFGRGVLLACELLAQWKCGVGFLSPIE